MRILQAYRPCGVILFSRRYYGAVSMIPYIYRGLYAALTKLSGTSYNAMKIHGPPQVHLRSLAM